MKPRILRTYCTAAIIAAGLVNTSPGQTQSQADRHPLAFEVASVKPSTPGGLVGGIRPMPGGQTYVATNIPMRLMMMSVYRISDSQIVGEPSWMDTERWDVDAKAEHPSNLDQLHEMFQTLLADRFKLQFHREPKEISAYVLSVDKSGSKLTPGDPKDAFDIPMKPGDRPGETIGISVQMSYLCWRLSLQLNTPVVNQTGLDGYYNFMLVLPPPPPVLQRLDTPGTLPAAVGSDLAADLSTALRQQLGLRLESRKTPVDVFVVDHEERPTNN
jgi:uncharacterized protein (TIGR03435 family)